LWISLAHSGPKNILKIYFQQGIHNILADEYGFLPLRYIQPHFDWLPEPFRRFVLIKPQKLPVFCFDAPNDKNRLYRCKPEKGPLLQNVASAGLEPYYFY
jgi:hypothetical protein